MSGIYDAELSEIREKLIEMGSKVDRMINDSIKSLVERDSALAEQTIVFDQEINALVDGFDGKCHQVLSACRPTLQDMRFLTMGLKIVTDLERIGDLCVVVARRALELIQEPPLKTYIELPRMAHWTAIMVKEALAAFIRFDGKLALKVCNDSHFVSIQNEQVQRVLLTFMMEDHEIISHGIKINQISKCFERIADHATKIAEMVIFSINRKDSRHTINSVLRATPEIGV